MVSSLLQAQWNLSSTEVYPEQRIYGFQLSPDGKQLSFILQRGQQVDEVTSQGDKDIKVTPITDIYLISTEGTYPRPLVVSGDIDNIPVWMPDGKHLAFSRRSRLQSIPVSGGPTQTIYEGKLYSPPLDIGDSYLGHPAWSPDGREILLAVRDEYQTTLLLVSQDGWQQKKLLSVDGYIIGWNWSPDGQQVLLVTRSEDGWIGDIRLLNVQTGESSILWEEENYEYQKPVAIWTPKQEIVFRSNRSGWSKLWVTRPRQESPRLLTFGEWDDYSFRLSPDGNQVVYASRAGQGSGDDLWIISIAGGQSQRLTNHPGINIPLAWGNDGYVYYWHTSGIEPGDLWVASVNDNKTKRLTWSAPIDLERKLRVPEETIITNEKDGTRVAALIYLPVYYKEGEQYPAIVWIRGGPTGISRCEFAPFYNWLANLGYVVITPNYRGSIGYGVVHMKAIAGEGLGKSDLSDVLATGQYVRTLPYVDLRRGAGIGGRSWGGYLSLMAVTQAPEDFSCAVAGAAISDWFVQQAQTEVRYYDYWLLGGWVYEQRERAENRSPVTFIDRIKTPLLVYHGEEDRDVPFAQIGQFVEKARNAGVQIEYITYPGEGHSNKKPQNQKDTLDRIQAFFQYHLQPWNLRNSPYANQVQY